VVIASDRPAQSVPLLASPSRRLGGALVDGLVGLVLVLSVVLARDELSRSAERAILTVPWAAYHVIAIAVWGRTLGKAAVGTQVVREADRGRVGWGAACTRWAVPGLVGLALSFVPEAGGVLSLLWTIVVYSGILRDAQRQGLHDEVAGTVVVYEPFTA
jgi:uncharacterized RDD family membrane protein YckC